ncbi:unnamed protein product [Paramecium sonneborni]|uniref:Uncharacterized protein n=1 Tax=Paramecium sonneborni TaxID=65129 RepID=A0A8S1NK68_9CILI|nr:unnamed protein product [Paramecium sonneborni]
MNNQDDKISVKLYMADLCYNQCVKSYMEKILTPFEKECMMKCLENIQGLRIEFYNAFNKK